MKDKEVNYMDKPLNDKMLSLFITVADAQLGEKDITIEVSKFEIVERARRIARDGFERTETITLPNEPPYTLTTIYPVPQIKYIRYRREVK